MKTTARSTIFGGIVGIAIPLLVFSSYLVVCKLEVAQGEHFLTAIPVLILALLEVLPVSAGRSAGLPIENGGAAFILYNLNGLGCALVLLFWGAVGSIVGCGIGIQKERL